MIKLLIGGSPCTYWSIAQSNARETEAAGIGWELFKNYLIAKEKFAPDYFLYENNCSAADAIKSQIKKELRVGVDKATYYDEINSARVSAQNRCRFYVHNCGKVEQPNDRGLLLKDIIESDVDDKYFYDPSMVTYLGGDKVCATLNIKGMDIVKRIYSVNSKSPTLTTCGGGHRQAKICINGRYRKLTPREYERLQTLPDDYTLGASDSQRYKMLGNGWTAEVIIHILQTALKDTPKDEKIVVLSMYDGIATGRYCLAKMGFTNVDYYAYEIDKYAIGIALKNYPDIKHCGDAFKVRDDNWRLNYENN